MSTIGNPQLERNRDLEMAIVRLKAGGGSKEDFALLQWAIEDMAEQATTNVTLAIGEIGQRAVGVMGAYRIVAAMLRDADGGTPPKQEVKDGEVSPWGDLPEDAEGEEQA